MKKRNLFLSVLLCALLGIMTSTAVASPYLEGEAQWLQVGPNNVAGRVRAAIFDKNNDGVIYAGTVGGLYVSVNYGKNWQEIKLDGSVQNVTAIAQDDDGLLYIGTGEGYYLNVLHSEDPTGHSNFTSGKIGSGVFKQQSNIEKNWANNLSSDEDKYNYVAEHFNFTLLSSTKPYDKYNTADDWAFINAMAYNNGTLYVGTKNAGLKYSTDGGNTFSNITIEGVSSFNVMDIVVNKDNRIAFSYNNSGLSSVAINNNESNTEFTEIFNNTTAGDNINLGRIKLSFGEKNPNNLFVMAAVDYVSPIFDYNGIFNGVYRPQDKENGINNVTTSKESWLKITPNAINNSLGTSLGYGMSICVNDREDEETVYMGTTSLLAGQDVNATGVFSFNDLTSPYATDTTGSFVPANIHNILLMPNPKNRYDSLYTLVTTDAGIYIYNYDSIINVIQWYPSVKGMNNLQSYKVAAMGDGSIISASQSNAIVYIPSISDTTLRGGMKIWSVNNPDYWTLVNNSTSTTMSSTSGSSVNASGIYRTLPSIRKPILIARPGSNITRTYSDDGDYESINDQTWTYGHTNAQTLLTPQVATNIQYDQFNTPIALWESFDFEGALDSVRLDLDTNTLIYRNGTTIRLVYGERIQVGDSVIVKSENLGYPFFHVFKPSDVNSLDIAKDGISYSLPSTPATMNGDVLFEMLDNMNIYVPQRVQSKALIATTTGAFICGKIMDFSITVDTAVSSYGNLTWTKLYHTGIVRSDASSEADFGALNKRIHAVALSADGNSAFLALDIFSSMNSYDHTELIRINGLNYIDINDDREFTGMQGEEIVFADSTKVIGTFTRQISSISCDPKNVNNMIITFDGYDDYNFGKNVMRTTDVLADTPNFEDISLKIDRTSSSLSDVRKPVFTALYESVNKGEGSSNRIYIGSDDGIYYTDANTINWKVETDVPDVAVYNLWQQTNDLDEWQYNSYSGGNAELNVFAAPQNKGMIYAATYGKGILVNKTYYNSNYNVISIDEVANNIDNIQTLSIYPNPAISQTTIQYTLNQPSDIKFIMFDINGREVSQFNTSRMPKGTHYQVMDIQNLKQGTYIIQMITNNSTQSTKLIVQ